MRRTLLLLATASTFISGNVFAQVNTGEGPVGKVAVAANGRVSFNGVAVTLDTLKVKLAELKQQQGVVWYYREAAGGEAPKEAKEVVKLVVMNRLPVLMSTKPDYSDVVLPDGTVKPRPGGSK